MSSQTAILGFHPNGLHFLFKLVISLHVFPCPKEGRGSSRRARRHSLGPVGVPPNSGLTNSLSRPGPPSLGPSGPQRETPTLAVEGKGLHGPHRWFPEGWAPLSRLNLGGTDCFTFCRYTLSKGKGQGLGRGNR